jgi:hypothetical protein
MPQQQTEGLIQLAAIALAVVVYFCGGWLIIELVF